MVSLSPSVGSCDLARNYNGLSAIAGIHVRLSKELKWFRCRHRYDRAKKREITLVWAPSASGRLREGPKIGQIGLGLAGGQKCSEMIIPKKEIIIDLEPA